MKLTKTPYEVVRLAHRLEQSRRMGTRSPEGRRIRETLYSSVVEGERIREAKPASCRLARSHRGWRGCWARLPATLFLGRFLHRSL